VVQFFAAILLRVIVIGGLLTFAAEGVGRMLPRAPMFAYIDNAIRMVEVERRLSVPLVTNMQLGFAAGEPLSWSPDGEKLAFQAWQYRDENFDLDLFVVSLADLTIRDVSLSPLIDDGPLKWSPDSKSLGFVSRTLLNPTDYNIWSQNQYRVVDVETGETRYQFAQPGSNLDPRFVFLPDGMLITSITSDNLLRGFRVDDQQQVTEFMPPVETQAKAVWSPDGKWLAYTNLQSIQLVNPHDGTMRQLSEKGTNELIWSQDSQHLVYTIVENGGNGAHLTVYVADIDDSTPHALTSSSANQYLAMWSPDSREIVFLSDPGGDMALYKVDVATRTSSLLVPFNSPPLGWSPDGRWLTVYALNPRNYANSVYLIDIPNQSISYLLAANLTAWRP
jgi:Tol biopolymer transport system component